MTDSATPAAPHGPSSAAKMPLWLFRTIVAIIVAAVLVIAYVIASVTLPLMWATSVRDQIGGELGNSVPLGMFYGFTFSVVPIFIAWQAHRRKFNKWLRISLVLLGLIVALPNLLTLGVLYGRTQNAVDARALWSDSANWFGTWSQIAMVVGVVCAVAVIVLGRTWLRRGRKIHDIKVAEKQARKASLAPRHQPAVPPAESTGEPDMHRSPTQAAPPTGAPRA